MEMDHNRQHEDHGGADESCPMIMTVKLAWII